MFRLIFFKNLVGPEINWELCFFNWHARWPNLSELFGVVKNFDLSDHHLGWAAWCCKDLCRHPWDHPLGWALLCCKELWHPWDHPLCWAVWCCQELWVQAPTRLMQDTHPMQCPKHNVYIYTLLLRYMHGGKLSLDECHSTPTTLKPPPPEPKHPWALCWALCCCKELWDPWGSYQTTPYACNAPNIM